MSEEEYKTFAQDCEESNQLGEDLFYFATHNPDVAQYLFY